MNKSLIFLFCLIFIISCVNVDSKGTTVQTSKSRVVYIDTFYLTMIHFDNASSIIKPVYYTQLHHLATVMKENPEIIIIVEGHGVSTVSIGSSIKLPYKRAKNAVDFLINNYGIPYDRFIITYKEESHTLEGINDANFINRRVEFMVKN